MIDEKEARRRRTDLEDESKFFGSMDGASKFVKGDAVAGLMITAINFVGGIIYGIAVHGVPFSEALASYGVLTVGDGLITQIPALMVSFAAGLLVSKGGINGPTERAFMGQLGAFPRALGLGAVMMGMFALMPGMPFFQFGLIAAVLGFLAWWLPRQPKTVETDETALAAAEQAKAAEDPVAAALRVDSLRIEISLSLAQPGILDDPQKSLVGSIKEMRKQMADDFGFVLPEIRIRDNAVLPKNSYRILVRNSEAGKGSIKPGFMAVINPRFEPIDMPGDEFVEPAFGMKAKWVEKSLRDDAELRGYAAVDEVTMVLTHLQVIVQDHLKELLTYSDMERLFENLDQEHRRLLNELCPARLPKTIIQRILQNLLAENVSIRDMPLIIEAVADGVEWSRNPDILTDHVRRRLSWQICTALTAPDGMIPVFALSSSTQEMLANGIVFEDSGSSRLSHTPSDINRFINTLNQQLQTHLPSGISPVLLVPSSMRHEIRTLLSKVVFNQAAIRKMPILGTEELHAKANIKTLAQI
jgi:flagellar biosynthesis protein FlhA